MIIKRILSALFVLLVPIFSFSKPQIQITSYHYRPSIGWKETRFNKNIPGSSIHIFFHNKANDSVSIKELFLDGEKVEVRASESQVVWWRLLPEEILPDFYGELTIYLRDELKQKIKAQMVFNNGKIEVDLLPKEISFCISQTVFKDSSLYLYLSEVSHIDNIYWDGKKISKNCEYYPVKEDNKLLIIYKMKNSPVTGSHHLVTIKRGEEKVENVVRVFEFPFVIGSYGTTGSNTVKAYVEHNLNTYLSFHSMKPEELKRMGNAKLRSISSSKDKDDVLSIKDYPSLLAFYLMDEPDVRDYFNNEVKWKNRVGWHAQDMVEWYNLRYRIASHIPSLLMVDATYKPANWYIYSQIPDITATDPYAKLFDWALSDILTVCQIMRNASAPRIFITAIQAHKLKSKEESRANSFPTPEEERKMVYYAIGGGSKGLAFFIYNGGNGSECWNDNKELADEIKKIGKILGSITKMLTISYPVDLANRIPQNCRIQTLLCGNRAIIVIIEGEKGFKGGEIEINTPKWFKANDVFLLDDRGLKDLTTKKDKNSLTMKVGTESCQFIIITGEAELKKKVSSYFKL